MGKLNDHDWSLTFSLEGNCLFLPKMLTRCWFTLIFEVRFRKSNYDKNKTKQVKKLKIKTKKQNKILKLKVMLGPNISRTGGDHFWGRWYGEYKWHRNNYFTPIRTESNGHTRYKPHTSRGAIHPQNNVGNTQYSCATRQPYLLWPLDPFCQGAWSR